MRTLGKIVGFFVLLFGAYVVWSVVREWHAKNDVQAFCGRFAVGSPMRDVANAAQSEGERMLRRTSADRVMVGYIGAMPFSRHPCTIEGKDGKVTSTRISHLD